MTTTSYYLINPTLGQVYHCETYSSALRLRFILDHGIIINANPLNHNYRFLALNLVSVRQCFLPNNQ